MILQAESRSSDIEEPTILKSAILKKLKGSHQYKKKFFVLLGNHFYPLIAGHF